MSPSGRFLYGGHVPANGIRQHYLRFGGTGTPLVIVPGITSPAATWDFVGERLGRRFDVHILDVRGRGLSSAGPDLAYDLDTYARDVADFGSALGLRRYLLLGHSMGARIAARFGRLFPEHAAALALADPPLSGPGRRPYVKPLDFYLDAIRQARRGELDVDAMRRTYPGWSEAQLRSRAEWLHSCDEAAITWSHRGFQEESIHGDFPAITARTLLLVAGKGGVITEDEVAEVRTLLPSIEIERMPEAGHMMPFDDLEGFAGRLERFFLAA